MGEYYTEQEEYVPHNINNSTVKLGTTKLTGIDSIVATLDDDEVTVDKVADGMAIDVENPSATGTVVITMLEASSSTDAMWTARANRTKQQFSFLDSAAPNLDTNGRCRIAKAAEIRREGMPSKVAWTLVFTYLSIRGGSYSIQQAE